jgi:hypothetical protein
MAVDAFIWFDEGPEERSSASGPGDEGPEASITFFYGNLPVTNEGREDRSPASGPGDEGREKSITFVYGNLPVTDEGRSNVHRRRVPATKARRSVR